MIIADLEEEILREHSRRHAEAIARWVGEDRRRFRKLMDLFLEGEYRVTQRAAWTVGICAERHPELIRPYLARMLRRMRDPGVHEAVRRNVVRLLQFVPIPAGLLGTVTTVCFDYLASADASIAVRTFSMTVLMRIAEKRPELGRELRLVVGRQLPYATAAFRVRARMVLRKLGGEPGACGDGGFGGMQEESRW